MTFPRIDWECGDILIGDECRHLAPNKIYWTRRKGYAIRTHGWRGYSVDKAV